MGRERIIGGGWGGAVKTIKYQTVLGTRAPTLRARFVTFEILIKSRRRYAVTNEQYYRDSGPINCGTVRICIFAKVTYATG